MALRRCRQYLLAAALLALPAGLAAQQDPAAPAAPAQPSQQEVQGWLAEMQQLHGRLEALQQQALQDAQLSAAQQALGSSIKAAMDQVDPQLEQSMARVAELEGQAAAAQQAGDQEKLKQLGAEAQQIQMQFMNAQQAALQQPEISAQVDAFQSQLEAKMVELDPEAKQVIERFRALETRLADALQAR